MACLVRTSLTKVPCTKALVGIISVQPARTITSKLDELPPKPKPWNYNERSFNYFHYLYDKTTARLDENSKVIVVEGPVAAGKSKFAKEIAKSFGMLYYPEANLDMEYFTKYGYDLRKLDPLLPPDCRSFDVMDFLKNPTHKLVARMQIQQYIVKFSQYIDALAHILSTGQGVVLDRCVYSDFVFVEAMFKQKYLSRAAYKKYYEYRDNTLLELLRPHLVIYLDVPVPKVIENVQKRSISYEKNSTVLNEKYLGVMEQSYKHKYLKEISKHSELLVYDWSVEGDMEIVVEDIEAVDFTKYDYNAPKENDWSHDLEEDYAYLRHWYADKKIRYMTLCNIDDYSVPELIVDAEDARAYHTVMAEAPGEKYEQGYNSPMGDGGLLFKWSLPKRDTLPLRERRTV